MPFHSTKSRQQLLAKLYSYIKKHAPKGKVELLLDFAKQYFSMVSEEDLTSRKIEDTYGAMLSHWEFMYKRQLGESKVRVFNPAYEKYGWQSTHTVIEIVSDDMPFLVDSVRMEINRHGYLVHHIVHVGGMRVKRDKQGQITEVLPRDKPASDSVVDAPIYVEIDRQTDDAVLENLRECLLRILGDVSIAVTDWQLMLDQLDQSLMELEQAPPPLDPAEVTESKAFLRWLKDNFILLGCRDYKLTKVEDQKTFQVVSGTGLGVLRESTKKHIRYLSDMPPEARKLALSPHILIIAKTNTKSTVHRSGYTDYVGVKVFDSKGNILGERRFIGLYTSSAYNSNPKHIPFLRLKVAKVLQKSGFVPNSHAGKKLLNILETLPRDDLFQAMADELLDLAMGVFHLQERQRIRLFMRKDSYGRFYSCLVFVPRESFNTELLRQMEDILREMLIGEEINYSIMFSESILARIHFMVRVDASQKMVDVDPKEIEQRLIEVGMSWRHELYNALVDYFGEAKGVTYFNKYRNAFLASFREAYNPKTAVYDIEHIESLSDEKPLSMNFYKPADQSTEAFRLKVYQRKSTVPLSDALPILENMGFRVIGERPHRVCLGDECIWINDFNLVLQNHKYGVDVEAVKLNFQRAFAAVWLGQAENDRFNELVITAGLTWRQAVVCRAYAKYFQQTGFTFSQSYIAETLINNAIIAKQLVDYFYLCFDPEAKSTKTGRKRLANQIEASCEEVLNLAEDRILRHYLVAITATMRTNFFQNADRNALALKIMPESIPGLPLPVPMYELFVYSVRFEAVHLRGAKVARGGLRWSDRREDFRTEILGLMKAQQVKNAVIVPLGAKGGFVPKKLSPSMSRDEVIQEAIACYQNFIRSMLDITDNIVGENIVYPENVVRYDEDDSYLVVAADKGTATFSDIANAISKDEYKFWLGDAFASGGSTGYDHKKMGITARGAWESVKRHFREMEFDVQSKPFTVVGIGDMAGDVFGNGMLLSKYIKLVAAFNHIHIFVDPDPDPLTSYKERKRLFNMPRSSWQDYNEKLISKGGGIFLRSDKSIKITPEMKKLLGIKREKMSPVELISAILKAEVDLLWNGGIGTYVKASHELNTDVGDRANDSLRINASELACKVIGEGGNLGFTQAARVEYALAGGMVYTDFIDNSAGVDCSDHEVNIKILLDKVIEENKLTEEKRNELLTEMTEEVGQLVLKTNYEQTLAISNTADRSRAHVDLYASLIDELEQRAQLNRELENLPSEKVLLERKADNKGLTKPELAVLFAYSKTLLKSQILESDLPEDPYFTKALALEFPVKLSKQVNQEMKNHRLKREIMATQISNNVINQMGITFVRRVQDETVAPVARVLKAFITAQNILSAQEIWGEIEALDLKVKANVQFAMMRQLNRLIKRATRWLLQNRPEQVDIETIIKNFKDPITKLREKLPELLQSKEKEKFEALMQSYVKQGVPAELAAKIALCPFMFFALDIVEGAKISNFSLEAVTHTFLTLNDRLEIAWLREQISLYEVGDHWSALARSGFSDDLDFLQRMLTIRILSFRSKKTPIDNRIKGWFEENAYLVNRWEKRISDLKALTNIFPMMFYVAIRDFQDLTQSHRKLLIFR